MRDSMGSTEGLKNTDKRVPYIKENTLKGKEEPQQQTSDSYLYKQEDKTSTREPYKGTNPKMGGDKTGLPDMSKTQTQQEANLTVITFEDLLAALQQTRMSVSPSELLKYSTIYQKFRRKITGKNEDSSYADKQNFFKAGSKSTLA